jgi:hypothetical protein
VKVILEGKDHPVIDLEVTKECLFPTYQYQVFGQNGSLIGNGDTVEWKYYIPAEVTGREVRLATMEGENRTPVYCSEKLNYYTEKWVCPPEASSFDDWGTKYYLNIYDALTTGAPIKVKLSQIRRQIGIIEECHRQNPLPKFVDVPEGTL